MAYTPTNWKSGDVITSAKLNKLEEGVANAGGGGGGVLVVHPGENGALEKTAREIIAALPYVYISFEEDPKCFKQLCLALTDNGEFEIRYYQIDGVGYIFPAPFATNQNDCYIAATLDDYPVYAGRIDPES